MCRHCGCRYQHNHLSRQTRCIGTGYAAAHEFYIGGRRRSRGAGRGYGSGAGRQGLQLTAGPDTTLSWRETA
jgi:hypothetical protein